MKTGLFTNEGVLKESFKIYLIGDVHGLFSSYEQLIKTLDESIQLGDYGVGFPRKVWDKTRGRYKRIITNYVAKPEHVFVRGNHDNTKVCSNHPNCLNKFGVYKGIFYIAGGYSIDKNIRTYDVDWWPDEEMNTKELYNCLNIYEGLKPNIVISHECPQRVLPLIHSSSIISTRTGQALDAMLEVHQPKYWFFGHHHVSFKAKVGQTEFQCLNELEVVCINELIQNN